MSTVPKFRIDVNVHSLLMNSASAGPEPPVDKGMSLPEPIYPRFLEKLSDPGPDTPPENRHWTLPQAYHKMKGVALPLRPLSSIARRVPPDHRVFVRGV